MRLTAGITIALMASLAMLAATGCQNDKVELSRDDLSGFVQFPVYWVGEEYAGSKLDRIIGQYPGEEDDPVLVLYGTCGASFEAGCTPVLVVKSRRGCLRTVDDGIKTRERMTSRDGHLQVQAGDVVVTIYAASPELEAAAAQDIVTANPGANAQIPLVKPNAPLPGSLCELLRAHPRVDPTPPPPKPLQTEEILPATVIASFGDSASIDSPDSAAAIVGWRVLRTNDPRFTLALAGALRTLNNSLPRLEQTKYLVVGRKYPIEIDQEPESYRTFDVTPYSTTEVIGPWTGELWTYRAQLGFEFFSGEVVDGQRIRVSVFGERGSITLDDIRAFVKTLTLGD